MTPEPNPTVRRRRLGAELRKIRERSGLTAAEAADRMAWSTSKISRIEIGRVSTRPIDVRTLLAIYDVSAEEVEPLVQLAVQSSEKGWWHRYSDVLPEWFDIHLGLESAASVVQTYEAELVPGLVQTEAYARAVLAAHPTPDTPDEIDRQVALRMQRQARLTAGTDPLWLHAVVNEAALRRPAGGAEAMRAQLRHLVDLCALPNVTVQVLPFAAGVHGATNGPFGILGFPDAGDPRVAFVDYLVGSLYLETLKEVGRYRLLFSQLCDLSLEPEESAKLIAELAEQT